MLISLNKYNSLEHLNADVLNLFRQTTCSITTSVYSNTLKVHSYRTSDSWKIVKIVHLFLLQFKWLTAKLVLVIALILLRKSFILERT